MIENGDTAAIQEGATAILDLVNPALLNPIYLGKTQEFSETFVGEKKLNRFEINAFELQDQKVYNLVAIATYEDGTTLKSAAVSFGVNEGLGVNAPDPRTLDNVPIESDQLNFSWIPGAYAQSDSLIRIHQTQPVIEGDSEFGTQVYAIWNSLVLASSVISDSEEGFFSIKAPQALEGGSLHRVSLYALKRVGNKVIRSDTVDVHFEVAPAALSVLNVSLALGVLALLIAIYWIVRRVLMRRKSSLNPDDLLPEEGRVERVLHTYDHSIASFSPLPTHPQPLVFPAAPSPFPVTKPAAPSATPVASSLISPFPLLLPAPLPPTTPLPEAGDPTFDLFQTDLTENTEEALLERYEDDALQDLAHKH
ncbi:hypothetical protein IPJ72_05330 [Candidatus Peregrinibacteria bacterium]|nr:MAG: hypothetical protein IPJ72_05330 [Candidatus Peregrinibacteria bacterium]